MRYFIGIGPLKILILIEAMNVVETLRSIVGGLDHLQRKRAQNLSILWMHMHLYMTILTARLFTSLRENLGIPPIIDRLSKRKLNFMISLKVKSLLGGQHQIN